MEYFNNVPTYVHKKKNYVSKHKKIQFVPSTNLHYTKEKFIETLYPKQGIHSTTKKIDKNQNI